jgi:hypothetical protein
LIESKCLSEIRYNFYMVSELGALKFSGQFDTWTTMTCWGICLEEEGERKVLCQLDKDDFQYQV